MSTPSSDAWPLDPRRDPCVSTTVENARGDQFVVCGALNWDEFIGPLREDEKRPPLTEAEVALVDWIVKRAFERWMKLSPEKKVAYKKSEESAPPATASRKRGKPGRSRPKPRT